MVDILLYSRTFPECGTDNDCNKRLDESSSNGPVQAYIADELLFRHWTDYKGEKESYLVLFDTKEKNIKPLPAAMFWQEPICLAADQNLHSHRIAEYWLMFLLPKRILQIPRTQIFT